MNIVEKFWHRRKQDLIDSQWDAFLTLLGLELEIKTPWEKALRWAGKQSPSPLKEEITQMVQRHTQQGMRLEESLLRFSQKWNSVLSVRMITLLMHISTHGASEQTIQGLKQLAQDGRMVQQNQLRVFTQKMSVLSLVFIGTATLVPSLFLAFVTVGSQFLELSLTSFDVWFFLLVVFPLLNALILGWVWIQTPALLLSNQKKGFGDSMKSIIRQTNRFFSTPKGHSFVRKSTIQGCSLFLIGWTAFLGWDLSREWLLVVGGMGFFPLVANLVWREIQKETRIRSLERQVPESLIMLASFYKTSSFENQLKELTRLSAKPIRGEWLKVVSRIEKGSSVPQALRVFGKNTGSEITLNVQRLLVRGYQNGSSIQAAVLSLANNGLSVQALNEEKKSALLVQKYTLIGAGGFLIPLLLGIIVGVVSALSIETKAILFSTVESGIRVYMMEYAVLAGGFLSLHEKKKGQSVGYALLLLFGSQIVFILARAIFSG